MAFDSSGNIKGAFREHSGNIQGTFRGQSGNIHLLEDFAEFGVVFGEDVVCNDLAPLSYGRKGVWHFDQAILFRLQEGLVIPRRTIRTCTGARPIIRSEKYIFYRYTFDTIDALMSITPLVLSKICTIDALTSFTPLALSEQICTFDIL
jgi:hypothetical protein